MTQYHDDQLQLQCHEEGDELLFAFQGEIDLQNLPEVSTWIESCLTNYHTTVVFDMEALGYIDSAGISWLFHLTRRLVSHSQTLCCRLRADHPLRPLFTIVRLDMQPGLHMQP